MAIMVVSAPAALAQQGNGLCQGASAVETFSGTTSVDETAPFNISTETFQVAVEITPTNNSDSATASVFVGDSNYTTLTSEFFTTDNLSGVIPVDNNGAGPFSLTIYPSEASYAITVYECGAAAAPVDNDADDNGTVDGEETDVPGDTNGDDVVNGNDDINDDGVVDKGDDMNNDGVVNEGDTGTTNGGSGANQYADDDDITALPDTGGPSIILAGATLLMGGGILGLLILRRRTE